MMLCKDIPDFGGFGYDCMVPIMNHRFGCMPKWIGIIS